MKIAVAFCTIAVVALSVNATVFFQEQFLDGGKFCVANGHVYC